MFKAFLLFVLFVNCLFCISVQGQSDFTYSIKIKNSSELKGCEISLVYHSKNTQTSQFLLPDIWGGTLGEKQFIHIKSIKGAKKCRFSSKDKVLNLKHALNAEVKITYFVESLVKDSIYSRQEEYLPNIQSKYFSCFTNSIFIVLNDSNNQRYNFDVIWKDYPSSYKSLPQTSFGDGIQQSLYFETIAEFQNGMMVGGDFQTIQFKDNDQIVRYIYRGEWKFNPSEMANLVAKTFRFQQEFWNDYSTKVYTVFMSPAKSENEFEMSYTGTGLKNSFNVVAINNGNANVLNMRYLLNHELMHHWIGNTILNGVDEELSYWFSEGFTDYFTYVNMFESGIINEKEYYFYMDSVFVAHYGNELKSAINDSIKPNFWKEGYYGKLPYNRGNLFAYYLDHYLIKKSNGTIRLKDVLREMLKEALTHKKPFSKEWLSETIFTKTGVKIDELIEKYIMKGEPISIATFNEVLPRQLELSNAKVFDLGFDFSKQSDGKKRVTIVVPNSGAEKAGIEIGQQVIGYSIFQSVNAESELYVLDENGKEKKIVFNAFVYKQIPQHVFKH